MNGFSIILLLSLIILAGVLAHCMRKKVLLDEQTRQDNANLLRQKEMLEQARAHLTETVSTLTQQRDKTLAEYERLMKSKQSMIAETQSHLDKGFANYVELLDKKYAEHEREFDTKKNRLEQQLESFIGEKQMERDAIVSKLDSLARLQEALHQDKLRREAEEQKGEFYKISLSPNEINDIELLESIRPRLNQGRVLSMLVWTNFIKKKVDDLFARVYGGASVGIYKITNLKNEKVYIGQSLDLKKRISTHIKCGLGIDTPSTNLLYQDMIKEGVWNFSFELLEECKQSELNAREKFFIEFFKSYEYGYNATRGNN